MEMILLTIILLLYPANYIVEEVRYKLKNE
jgi:hypothetical protein